MRHSVTVIIIKFFKQIVPEKWNPTASSGFHIHLHICAGVHTCAHVRVHTHTNTQMYLHVRMQNKNKNRQQKVHLISSHMSQIERTESVEKYNFCVPSFIWVGHQVLTNRDLQIDISVILMATVPSVPSKFTSELSVLKNFISMDIFSFGKRDISRKYLSTESIPLSSQEKIMIEFNSNTRSSVTDFLCVN